MIQDIVSLIRNIFVITEKNTKFLNYLFILLGLGLGIWFNFLGDQGLLGLLPVFASLQYSIIILLPNNNELMIKASIAVSCICWTIYGYIIMLIPTIIFNIITFVLSIISIVRIIINRNKSKNETEEV